MFVGYLKAKRSKKHLHKRYSDASILRKHKMAIQKRTSIFSRKRLTNNRFNVCSTLLSYHNVDFSHYKTIGWILLYLYTCVICHFDMQTISIIVCTVYSICMVAVWTKKKLYFPEYIHIIKIHKRGYVENNRTIWNKTVQNF